MSFKRYYMSRTAVTHNGKKLFHNYLDYRAIYRVCRFHMYTYAHTRAHTFSTLASSNYRTIPNITCYSLVPRYIFLFSDLTYSTLQVVDHQHSLLLSSCSLCSSLLYCSSVLCTMFYCTLYNVYSVLLYPEEHFLSKHVSSTFLPHVDEYRWLFVDNIHKYVYVSI